MKKIFFVLVLALSTISCSIKYQDSFNAENSVPEFKFEESELTRYEKRKITVSFSAQELEQYKKSSESFAKNIEFTSFDDNGEVSVQGSCGLLSADTDTETYLLFDNITVYSKEDDVSFSSDSLKWDAKTEQLTSGRSDTVKIIKDNATIYGTGFSSSGLDKSFRFSGTSTGEIITEDNNQPSTNIQETENVNE